MRFSKLLLLSAAVAAISAPVDFSAQSYDDAARGGGFGRGGRRGGGPGEGFGGGFGRRFGGGAAGAFGNRFGGGPRNAAPERATSAPLELRGIVGRGENAMVSIVNIETGESRWVRVRDTNPRNKWFVESVNPKARNAVVRYEGMPMKLELITTTGEPMSIRPQPVPLAADSAAEGGANPRALASQMLAFGPFGSGGSPDQMRNLGEQMQTLTPEQRVQVFDEFRRMRGDMGGQPSVNVFPGGAGAGMQQPAAGTAGRGGATDSSATQIRGASDSSGAAATRASRSQRSSTGSGSSRRSSR